jgi:hypothetical protein
MIHCLFLLVSMRLSVIAVDISERNRQPVPTLGRKDDEDLQEWTWPLQRW